MNFKDNFSSQAATYRSYRPTYPDALFAYLRSQVECGCLALDCGTGNGQAALGLAPYFDAVIATDPSPEQIAQATPHPRITYQVERAEASGLSTGSVDLLTVAQALHWFDFDLFYAEAKRVLKTNGVIAAWAYGLPHMPAEIQTVIRYFHDEVVGAFWQAENDLISKKYTTVPFPFEAIEAPPFFITKRLTIDDVLGQLYSWSATQKFMTAKGFDPVKEVSQSLLQAWGNGAEEKEASWKLYMKIGRNK